jgi:hypothetical protein
MLTTFSKRGLSVRQFRRNIAQLWQPAIAKRFTSERPFLGQPLRCPLVSKSPRYRNPASLGAANTAAKPQFASAQRCFCWGNGGMRERAVLLESLFLIRICSRDPGPHILAKQYLVGAGN